MAGKATQGTRLMINFTNIPAGSYVTVPNCVNLINVIGGGTTGVAVLITNTSTSGFGGTPARLREQHHRRGRLSLPNRAVYEVFFSNPNALEQLSRSADVSGYGNPTPNLPSNLPAPNVISQIQGNFAPFYDARTTFAARLSPPARKTPSPLRLPWRFRASSA